MATETFPKNEFWSMTSSSLHLASRVRDLLLVIALGAALLPLARWLAPVERQWPQRPVELVVFTAPGGSVDQACRTLAAAMAGPLGAEIRVANMTGGRGGVAAEYVFGRRHDGYRWLGVSESILSLAARGSHHTTTEDWHHFVFAGSPGVISVPVESPLRTYEDLLKAVRAEPGRLTIAASGRGSIWHLRTEMLRLQSGLDLRYIPYEGSSASQIAALSREVDLVHTALAEQISLIKGGRLRPLVAVELEALKLGDGIIIPSITQFQPELTAHLPLPQWIGFRVPRETPPEVLERIEAAFHQAQTSPSVREFVATGYYRLDCLSGNEARRMVRRSESQVNWLMFDLGLVEKSPADFGIPRL